MLRWCLPETTTTATVKFDVYSVVTGSVTPASCCCFSSSPNWIGRRKVPAPPNWFSLLSLTLVTFHFRHTGPRARHLRYSAVPVVFLAKSAAHTHSRGHIHTRARTHTGHNALLWLLATVARRKIFRDGSNERRKNAKQILLMHSGNVRITPAGGHFNESG